MNKKPSLFGGAMIIAGTIIGAGMLANPTATSGVWFIGSLMVLLYTWFSMLTSGLMILEVNTHYPSGANFDTLVRDLLGQGWNIVNGVSVAFVLYLLTYAYIYVGGSLTAQALGGQALWLGQLAFFIVFAGCVWWSSRAVDRFSSILIGGMIITFIWATGGLLSHVQLPVLLNTAAPADTKYWIYVGTALPVCLASFGFHGNVSSLYKYFDGDAQKVARSLCGGTLIALVIYVLWQLAIHGNLPRSAFTPMIQANSDVPVLIQELSKFIRTGNMASILTMFSYMAIASSFLGVTLGLFDYLSDLFGFDNTRIGRSKAGAITFLPPLVACLLFPLGFDKVIGYVGMAAAIWTAIVPALLLAASRKKHGVGKKYRIHGSKYLIIWVFLFGLLNIGSQLLSRGNVLPVFTGESISVQQNK